LLVYGPGSGEGHCEKISYRKSLLSARQAKNRFFFPNPLNSGILNRNFNF
jgi:hypothetical protein